MGTNVAPILANLYLAKLQKILREEIKNDPKMAWPILFKRFIDDGFGITKGSKSDVEYWILNFKLLVESIKIDKFKHGSKVEYMDLVIFKGNRFHQKGLFDINIFPKEQNLYAYIPKKSNHKNHTFENLVVNELKRYAKYNSEKLGFYKLRNKFFDRLRNGGFRKYGLSKLFSLVSYSARHKYFLTSDNIYSTIIQETQADRALTEVAEEIFREHTTTQSQEPNQEKKELRGTHKDGTTTPTDKVVPFGE